MEIKKHVYTELEAYVKLSALCASAEYCEADMRKKMSRWHIISTTSTAEGEQSDMKFDADADDSSDADSDIQERIINKLREEKFIDDARYAHAFVRDKFRYNRWGNVRIQQELRARKIDQCIIDEALEEITDDDNLDALRALIENKRRYVKGKSDYDIRCKLIRFAIGKGFQMDDIMRVLDDK